MAHDAGCGPGGGPSRGPGDAAPAAPAGAEPHLRESVARAAKAPRLVVDLKKGRHRISPLIYGVNFAEPGLRQGRRPAGQPLGRQQHRDLQLADPGQQPRAGLVLHELRGLLVRRVRLLPARPGLQRRRRAGAAGPGHEDRDAADPARCWGGSPTRCRTPATTRAATPRRTTRRTTTTPTTRSAATGGATGSGLTADPTTAGRRGRAGVLGAVDRGAQGEVRRRAARRRLDLRARQRAGALGRHPPRLPPPAHDVRRALDQVARPRAGGQGRRPGCGHARPGRVGLAQLLLLGRRQRRPGLLPDLAGPRRARRHRAVGVVPAAVRGLRAADRPPAARLLRPALLPAGRQYSPVTDVTRPLWDTVVHRPLVDQREDRAAPPDAVVGARQLPGHQARHHRVQPGPRRHLGPAAAERHRGRRPRHLRPRGARPRDVLARRRARRSRPRRSGSSATTTASTTASATCGVSAPARTSAGCRSTPPGSASPAR